MSSKFLFKIYVFDKANFVLTLVSFVSDCSVARHDLLIWWLWRSDLIFSWSLLLALLFIFLLLFLFTFFLLWAFTLSRGALLFSYFFPLLFSFSLLCAINLKRALHRGCWLVRHCIIIWEYWHFVFDFFGFVFTVDSNTNTNSNETN